jgi:hypothetical protein
MYRASGSRYDYRESQIETAPLRGDVPGGAYPRDTRYENAGRVTPSVMDPANPPIPSLPSAPPPVFGDQRTSEPGVARFDGTISTPPVRTSYDRTGSNAN